jgi:hypothetical protein
VGDLGSGRYPDSEEEWLLDGSPYPPFRRSMSRRDITSVFTPGATSGTIYVVAVAVQTGDIFGMVSFCVKTVATGTSTHSWVAVYNGVATGAALLGAQSPDVTTGFPVGDNNLLLGALAANIGTVGTPQGGGSAAVTPNGPAVWGVAIYNSQGTNGPVIDGMAGGNIAGEVVHTGQIPLLSSGTLAATATAPAVLPTMAAATATLGLPYVLLSRS